MSKTFTEYIIVPNEDGNLNKRKDVARLLDEGYTLVISWIAGDAVHHILSYTIEGEEVEDEL
jgi:hypothetical protein